MVNTDLYTYRVHWSKDDDAFIATAAELPSLSWIADTPREALDGMLTLVREVASEMAASGETPPTPIATREFSGRFLVRVPPETHRELALAAAEQHVSLNRLAATRLVSA